MPAPAASQSGGGASVSRASSPESNEHVPARERWAETYLDRWSLDGTSKPGAIWGGAHCQHPTHGGPDTRPSLRFNLYTGAGGCHGGKCGFKSGVMREYADACGLPTDGLPDFVKKQDAPQQKRTGKLGKEVASYVYRTADGTPLFKQVRFEPKDFRLQHISADGTWRPGRNSIPLIPYRLPELVRADASEPVFWPEGEKDAENGAAAGVVTTTTANGAKSVKQVDLNSLQVFKGRTVVLLPDNDQAGQDYAAQVGTALQGIAAKVLMLRLPGLPAKGDLSDWLASDKANTGAALRALLETEHCTPFAPPEPAPRPAPAQEQEADSDMIQLRGITADKVEMVRNLLPPLNTRSLRVFYSEPQQALCAFETQEDGSERVEAVTSPEQFGNLLEGTLGFRFYVMTGSEDEGFRRKATDFPDKASKRYLALSPMRRGLPIVKAFISSPVVAPDGTFIQQPGLHASSGLFYQTRQTIPEIPCTPTQHQVEQSVALLMHLVADFPFDSQASRQAWFAYFLTPLIAHFVPRPYPLFHIGSTQSGGGKGYLASSLFWARGLEAELSDLPATEEEIRKKLTSLLASDGSGGSSADLIVFDNVRWKGIFSSPSLEAFITKTRHVDRILGTSRTGAWDVKSTVAMTGNDVRLGPDLKRREVLIRLTPDDPDQHLRTDFKIKDLKAYCKAHSPQLLHAAGIIVANWLAKGCPSGTHRMGSFEAWSAAMGGILETAGVGAGFLDGGRSRTDSDSSLWHRFVYAWAKHPSASKERQPPSELVRFANAVGISLSGVNPAMSLGRKLNGQRDHVFRVDDAVYKLGRSSQGNNTFWSLSETDKSRSRRLSPESPENAVQQGSLTFNSSISQSPESPGKIDKQGAGTSHKPEPVLAVASHHEPPGELGSLTGETLF